MTNWGYNGLGYIVYKRTYARPVDDNKTEEWPETVDRIIKACQSQLNTGFDDDQVKEFSSILLDLKGLVAGRFLWQLGTKTVDRLGLMSLQNCAGVAVDHPIRPFTWTMDALMLGSGVGYNIQREYVYKIPKLLGGITAKHVDSWDCDFIVPDNREGWCQLLQKVLEAAFYTGKSFTYTTKAVRPAGQKIESFGGVASGPDVLIWGMEQIVKVLNTRANKHVRPIDCLDIMNIIGYIVVAGNVRRSAQLAIGDYDDELYLNAKRWDLGNIPNWRAMSNNSVACHDVSKLPSYFWNGYKGNGEPYGIINLKLAREVGRAGEVRPDKNVVIFNPCVEQPLNNYETCCLAEIVLPRIVSYDELKIVATYLYRVAKHSLSLGCHAPETEAVIRSNMRMGIGVTGYMEASEDQRNWLKDLYTYLRNYDIEYSAKHNWPTSIRLTTVKPSGTLSLLAGVTSGVHPGYSKYFIRRVRMSANSPLVSKCREAGYVVEYQIAFDGTPDYSTVVVEFPCKHPDNTALAKDMSAVDQLEVVKRLQAEWSDNGVSCTVYYRPHELEAIHSWLVNNFSNNLKAISFLLHSEHGFVQPPLEEITEDVYNERLASIRPIEVGALKDEDIQLQECETGACPVK